MKFDPAQIKCIVSDLDGTLLLSNAELGERTVAAVRACTARGLQVILATGRSLMAAEPYRAQLDLKGPMIYYNGAELVHMPEGRIEESHLFPVEAAIYCVNLARKRHIHFHVFFIDDADFSTEILMSENPSNAAAVYTERTGLNFQYGDLIKSLNSAAPPQCAKGLFIADDSELEDVRRIINAKFGTTLNIVKSASTFLEVLNNRASKGAALESVLKTTGWLPKEVIAFGDEENDISMLKTAGHAVAPANAKDAVKAAAQTIIGNHDDESVAAFLETHFL
ncbi:MAG: Cof-type HAD-IIB family hydrolase [Spirochaetaceae bacterium]|nr:Cof-type HAD-IIB family hydrolase [Spirochaetaceae bacterium]